MDYKEAAEKTSFTLDRIHYCFMWNSKFWDMDYSMADRPFTLDEVREIKSVWELMGDNSNFYGAFCEVARAKGYFESDLYLKKGEKHES